MNAEHFESHANTRLKISYVIIFIHVFAEHILKLCNWTRIRKQNTAETQAVPCWLGWRLEYYSREVTSSSVLNSSSMNALQSAFPVNHIFHLQHCYFRLGPSGGIHATRRFFLSDSFNTWNESIICRTLSWALTAHKTINRLIKHFCYTFNTFR